MRERSLWPVCAIALLSACESPDLPVSYETEHLRIGTDLEHPLCAGDLVAFETIIRRVEDELELSMKGKFDVWIWSDEAWATVMTQYCPPETGGCTVYRDNTIYTSWSSVQHELGHAAISIPNLPNLFAEGLAEVYGGEQTRFGFSAPTDNLGLSTKDLDWWTARHFVMWLRETWGGAKLGELASLGKRADERFHQVYGLSLSEAQEMYFADAPYGYPKIDSCDGAPIAFAENLGAWRTVVDLDCDTGSDVRVAGIGRVAHRTFVIPVAGHYTVSTDADAIMLSRCATGPIEVPVRLEDTFADDVPPNYAGELSENFAFYEGGTSLDLYFEAGKHDIGLLLAGYDEGEAKLSIWPSLGPRPVGGEN